MAENKIIPFHYRLLGFFPLMLFGARLLELNSRGETADILWICHISNLLIALGLFLGYIELVYISTLWLIIGAPLWPIEIIRTGIMELTSIGTHYVGLTIGLLLIRQLGVGKRSWLYALIWFLLLQQFTRMFTPMELKYQSRPLHISRMGTVFFCILAVLDFYNLWFGNLSMVIIEYLVMDFWQRSFVGNQILRFEIGGTWIKNYLS